MEKSASAISDTASGYSRLGRSLSKAYQYGIRQGRVTRIQELGGTLYALGAA